MSVLRSRTYIEDLKYAVENTNIFDEFRNQSILITGATGLIGSGIVDVLLMANSIKNLNTRIYIAARNLDKAKKRFENFLDKNAKSFLTFVNYDATQSNMIDFYVDYIIHAAGNAHPKAFVEYPVDTMIGNINGLNELLTYAKNNKTKNLLYVSSSEVYGQKNDLSPWKETEYGYLDILNPRNAYASSKRAAETLCVSYYKQYAVKTNIVRPGHIYGPTASPNDSRVGSVFAYSVAMGSDIVLKSDGKQLRSYCYVLDCVTAILTVLVKGEVACAYNISNCESIISIEQLAKFYALKGNVNLIFACPTKLEKDAFNPMSNSSLDSTKIESLGWKGLFDAKMGSAHTITILKEIQEVL